jgi:hypothetical protein
MLYFSLLSFTQRYKAWLIGVILVACLVLFYADKKEKRLEYLAEAQRLQSISVLPEGVETLWLSYIERRLGEEIQREGHNLRVRTAYIGAAPTYAYVSLNHPYEIDCNGFDLGISVSFTSGEDDSISAALTGNFSLDHKNEPERGVPIGSIASDRLDLSLCEFVSHWMGNITSTNPI